jgi:hypothetical protein
VRVATIAVNGPLMAKTKDRHHDSLESNVIVTYTSVAVVPVPFAAILLNPEIRLAIPWSREKRCYLNDEVLISPVSARPSLTVKNRTAGASTRTRTRFVTPFGGRGGTRQAACRKRVEMHG